MTEETDFITLQEVAILLGDEDMDKRTVRAWLNDQNVKMQRIGRQLKVSKVCVQLAKEKIFVNNLKHQYPEEWSSVYETIAVDEKLKKVMLQINNKKLPIEFVGYKSEYFNV